MSYRVVFSPEVQEQLRELYHHIGEAASPKLAERYIDAIVSYCESMATFPYRGTQRDDVRPGLRITHYRNRAVIAFTVEVDLVSILGVYYGGQDYDSLLREQSYDEFPEDLRY